MSFRSPSGPYRRSNITFLSKCSSLSCSITGKTMRSSKPRFPSPPSIEKLVKLNPAEIAENRTRREFPLGNRLVILSIPPSEKPNSARGSTLDPPVEHVNSPTWQTRTQRRFPPSLLRIIMPIFITHRSERNYFREAAEIFPASSADFPEESGTGTIQAGSRIQSPGTQIPGQILFIIKPWRYSIRSIPT